MSWHRDMSTVSGLSKLSLTSLRFRDLNYLDDSQSSELSMAVKPVRPVRPVTCVTAVLSVTCCLQLVTYPPFEKHSHPWRFDLTVVRYYRMVNYYDHMLYIQSHIFEVVGWVRQSARAQHMLEMPKKHWIALNLYDSTEDMLPTFNVWYVCAPNCWEWRLCTIDDVPTLNIQTHLVLSEEQVQRCISFFKHGNSKHPSVTQIANRISSNIECNTDREIAENTFFKFHRLYQHDSWT